MAEVSNAPSRSRWDEFRTRPFQNYVVTILALNSAVVAGFGLIDPDWVESMHVFSFAFAPQLLLVLGYFLSRLYDTRWYRVLTVIYSVFVGLISGLGWGVLLVLSVGYP